MEIKLKFLVKIVDGSYSEAQTSCTHMYTDFHVASSSSSRLLIFINGNVFRIYFSIKTPDSIIYIKWEWKLVRLKVFWFFLDEIIGNLQWRLGHYILIKTGNCGKMMMERDFLINWLFRTWSLEAATYLHLILTK